MIGFPSGTVTSTHESCYSTTLWFFESKKIKNKTNLHPAAMGYRGYRLTVWAEPNPNFLVLLDIMRKHSQTRKEFSGTIPYPLNN